MRPASPSTALPRRDPFPIPIPDATPFATEASA